MGAARVPHSGKELLELNGFGGGPLRGQDLLPNHILVGANQTCFLSPGLQNGLEKIRAGGLPVGPGDAHHGHGFRRMAVEVASCHRQGPAGVRHLDVGDSLPFRRNLAQHRRRAGGHGLGDELVSVRRIAAEGRKQVPGPHPAGVVLNLGDLRLQIRGGGEDFQALQQFFQLHTCQTSIQLNTSWMIITRIKRNVYGISCRKPGKTCSQSLTELSPKRTVTTLPGASSAPSSRSWEMALTLPDSALVAPVTRIIKPALVRA